MGAKLDTPYIAHPRIVIISAGLDDHSTELVGIIQPAFDIDRVLERLIIGRRRNADLTSSDLFALLLQRLNNILCRQAARLHLFGIQPNAHGILPSSEDADIAHAL